jgi:hypothetical protein
MYKKYIIKISNLVVQAILVTSVLVRRKLPSISEQKHTYIAEIVTKRWFQNAPMFWEQNSNFFT